MANNHDLVWHACRHERPDKASPFRRRPRLNGNFDFGGVDACAYDRLNDVVSLGFGRLHSGTAYRPDLPLWR
jgi:hypothetical protein